MRSVTLISLTDPGSRLAARWVAAEAHAEHRHRPQPFAEIVQQHFRSGHALGLITATGIAVRSLAPVIADKHTDPPVLVVDEHGQFVIPLLGGHEAGANEWGRQVADRLGAQLVLTTTAAYTRPTWVAGLGCDRGCAGQELAALLQEVLTAAAIAPGALAGLASIDLKAGEPGLALVSTQLEQTLVTYPAETLRQWEHRLSQPSAAVYAAVGCYGVAEAAALARAAELTGNEPELVVAKRKSARATAALARAYGKPDHG